MKIILSSNSPRRKELLAGLGVDFEVRVLKGIDEQYPADIPLCEVPLYIAAKKASAYTVGQDELVVTADTVVIVDNEILGKPKDRAEAYNMLRKISGKTHQVVTGVCLTTIDDQRRFAVTTDVEFKELSDNEIYYYIDKYRPFDKAGAYGIQEWIGYVGVKSLNGSYYNVMGLPVQRIYEEFTSHFGLDLCANK
jgi:septum formation protein